jgi:hypothetical protein
MQINEVKHPFENLAMDKVQIQIEKSKERVFFLLNHHKKQKERNKVVKPL